MSEPSQTIATHFSDVLPEVHIEVRQGGRSTSYALSNVEFIVGTVPGCDLRVPGANLPPVLCSLARHPHGLMLRKLAPTQLLLVNGNTVSQAELADGDRITLGAVDFFVRVRQQAGISTDPRIEEYEEKLADLEAREEALQRERDRQTAAAAQEVGRQTLSSDLENRAAEIQRQELELAKQRQELVDIRRQLYERYQERRDRLAGLQEAVDRAARKVQERKRLMEVEEQNLQLRKQADGERQTELARRAAETGERARELAEERRLFEARQKETESEWQEKHADLERREETVAGLSRDVDARLKQYQVDLIRLDRLQGAIEKREKDLIEEERSSAEKLAQLRKERADLEAELIRFDRCRVELTEESNRLALQKADQGALEAQLTQRTAILEGQQQTLAALRARLERMREEVRQQEQHGARERQAQEEATQKLADEAQALEALRAELEAERDSREHERGQMLERSAILEAAVANLKKAQEKLADEESRLELHSREVEEKQRLQAESASTFEARRQELTEAEARLDDERAALRERTQALAHAEEVREALQEQLRRRGEELAERQRTLTESMNDLQSRAAALERRQADMTRHDEEARLQLEQMRLELGREADTIQERHAELSQKEVHHRQQFLELQALGKEVAGQRKNLSEERAAAERESREWLDAQTTARAEFDALRKEATQLQRQLPDLELHAGTTLERLTHAREQLRDHLAELHGYVHACQDDLDQLRGRIQKDEANLQDQELALRKSQEEHRLAMVAFRQQLIGWQGQITDMKRLLASDETRLERKEAQVAEQVKALDQTTEKLARQAEELQKQEAEVAGRRQEMDRHLGDMQAWYRQKLRELAGIDLAQEILDAEIMEDGAIVALNAADPPSRRKHEKTADDDQESLVPTGRNILSLTEPVDDGDRRLGETLTQLELVDGDTLTALLIEARRQRRSLRQVLLAGGVVTVYQLALIEAGQMERLMIGPVRVIDRLRVSRSETIYRVFDPRRGQEAVLRQLSDDEIADAAHAADYRDRFAKTIIDHPNLARTLEVLDIAGRPAVLQEWLCGLPSSDWPPLAAAPGVCFRLLTQAALGLATLHDHGLTHDRLTEASLFLTGEGLLKITGFGEPRWLTGEDQPRAALKELGRIVSGWCTATGVRKGAKAKALPESLVSILYRLNADGESAYTSATQLLEDLDQTGSDIPANTEAWDRLLRYVRDHGAPEAILLQSA